MAPKSMNKLTTAANKVLHFPGAIGKTYHDSLMNHFVELAEFKVAHTMTMPRSQSGVVKVTSRPKLVFAKMNEQGEYGLYHWGQVEDDYAEIGPMPDFAQQFMECVEQKYGHIVGAPCGNHFLVTFSHGIPAHQDKRFSAESSNKGPSAPEDFRPLLLFSFGAPCKLSMTYGTGSSYKVVREINFGPGDFVFVPGHVNALLKHKVDQMGPGDRVSVVIRTVTAHHVNPTGGYYLLDGVRNEPKKPWVVKQLELPSKLVQSLEFNGVLNSDSEMNMNEEIEAMESWDFDAGSTRLVGQVTVVNSQIVRSNFGSPYWEAACKRSLVDGLVEIQNKSVVASLDVPEDGFRNHFNMFDAALEIAMASTTIDSPHFKSHLTEHMCSILLSSDDVDAFRFWYAELQDRFSEKWCDPNKFAMVEDIIASIVEGLPRPTSASSTDVRVAKPLLTVEALIPVDEKQGPRVDDAEPVSDESIAILTFKTDQIVKCSPYLESRVPKEIEVKSMFTDVQHARGQRWRTTRLRSASAITKEFVKCVMESHTSSYLIAARGNECVMFYYAEDRYVRNGFQVTDAMVAIHSDVVMDHWTFLHPSGNNKQNIMEAVKQLGDWGTLVAGNMKVQSMQKADQKGGPLLTMAECQRELMGYSMSKLQEFIADSKIAKKQKQATTLQESVLTISHELVKWIECCQKLSSVIFDIKDGPVYPDGFCKDHSTLMGYEVVAGSKHPVQISLKDHMYNEDKASCVFKSAYFVGKQGGGKSSIAMALARLCAIRCGREKVLFSKSFDPIGELTRSGLISQVGAFVFSDFSWTSLMNTRLLDEDIMAILDVAEPASFKCRYHVGIMEKNVPRFFCINAGKAAGGGMDHGAGFDEEGLDVLGALARGQSLEKFTDKQVAMARRVVIFPITTDDDIALDVSKEVGNKKDMFALLLEAEQDYRAQNDARV